MKFWKRKIKESTVPIIDQLGVLSDKLKEAIIEIDDITMQMKTENKQKSSRIKDINHGRT